MTKMNNYLVGYIALLWQLAYFCKGWVGDHGRHHSICIMAYTDCRWWGEPTPPIYIYISIIMYIVYTIYMLLDLALPNKISGYANVKDDSALIALSSLRGLRGATKGPPLCRET